MNKHPRNRRQRPRFGLGNASKGRFRRDGEGSAAIIKIGGLTVTLTGLLGWFFGGSFMVALGDLPEIGPELAALGFAVIIGVVVVLGLLAHERWG